MSQVAKIKPASSEDAMKDATALIQGMELPYLQQLQTALSMEIDKRLKEGRRDAIAKIRSIAAAAGIDLDSLSSHGPSTAPKKTMDPIPAKYRHPEDATLEWSGRGRQKQWVKDWVDSGKSLDDLKIA